MKTGDSKHRIDTNFRIHLKPLRPFYGLYFASKHLVSFHQKQKKLFLYNYLITPKKYVQKIFYKLKACIQMNSYH